MWRRPPLRAKLLLVVLLVEDARGRRHPLHVAGADDAGVARVVAMRDAPSQASVTVSKPRCGCQPTPRGRSAGAYWYGG